MSHVDEYFDVPGAYTEGPLGVEDAPGMIGNYYRTLFGYDAMGRAVRVQAASGTIYRTDYDALGRAVAEWVGTSDANAVKVSESEYDHGTAGPGLLTKVTEYPGLGQADQMSEFFHDWRYRLVASKSGVEASESGDVNRPIGYDPACRAASCRGGGSGSQGGGVAG